MSAPAIPAGPELDALVLAAVRERPGAATYVVRNMVGKNCRRGVKTPAVLRSLRRLERQGLVEQSPSSYVVMLCWREVK